MELWERLGVTMCSTTLQIVTSDATGRNGDIHSLQSTGAFFAKTFAQIPTVDVLFAQIRRAFLAIESLES
jgi:hypothetical protein